ncbi:activating signal cointegrator 1 [Loa loa]|nr:activating signal cointegrator 1 [Loa loa]EJD75696.1 activating signal cointegrator 1 [Loa loa]
MDRSDHSLKSLAASLNKTHSQQQEPSISVTFKNKNPADELRPGRHRCDCQARTHKLIRNCMSCGRVVCEQEGSGPCMFCGELVCTREERKLLNQQSRKSVELYYRLMGCEDDKTVGGGVFSLASVGSALAKAEQYKNKLLAADSNTEMKTRIHDLESDYYNMENNIYLTKAEREAILNRKEELKELRMRQRRALVMDFDLEETSVFETKSKHEDTHDPVIESILLSSRRRQQTEASKPIAKWAPDGFVLKYNSQNKCKNNHEHDDENDREMEDVAFMMLSDEMIYMEVARKGYSMGIVQPIATLLAYGFRRHLPWNEDVDIRGPIIIASKGKTVSRNEIEKEISRFWHSLLNNNGKRRKLPSEFPSGAIVGRALLTDCLSMEEYDKKYLNKECSGTEGSYVLIFDVFEPLLIPIPHVPLSDGIYQVDKQLLTAIKQILEPVSFS